MGVFLLYQYQLAERIWYNIIMSYKYTEEMLREAVKVSESYAEVVRRLGAGRSGSAVGHLKRRIKDYKIDTSHFTHRHTKSENKKRRLKEDILVLKPKGSNREARKNLLRAMIESGIEYSCAECPLDYEWNGKILNLEIDHINGNGIDNRLENLRFLCPNCHSQMHTSNHSKAFNPYADDLATQEAVLKRKKEIKDMKINICKGCNGHKYKYAKQCKKCVDLRKNLPSSTKKNFIIKDEELDLLVNEVKATSYKATARKYKYAAATIKAFFIRNGVDPVTFERIF